jgi:hypothetical protein
MFRAQWMSSLPDFGSFSWSLMNCMALALSFTFVDFAWRGILPRNPRQCTEQSDQLQHILDVLFAACCQGWLKANEA